MKALSVLLLTLAALALPRPCQAADAPKGFRGIVWGAKPTTSLKILSSPTDDGTSMYVPKSKSSVAPLFDLTVAEEAYSFTYSKFYSASAWLDGAQNFEKMKAVLTKTYGAPAFSNERLPLIKWKWPAAAVEVSLSYQSGLERTTVTYTNKSL